MIQWHLLTGPGILGDMSSTAVTATTLLSFVTPFRFDGVMIFSEFVVLTDERSEDEVEEDDESVEAEKFESGFFVAGDFVTRGVCCGFLVISVFVTLNLFPVEHSIARDSTIGLTGERSFETTDISVISFEG